MTSWEDWIELAKTLSGAPDKDAPLLAEYADLFSRQSFTPAQAAEALRWAVLFDPHDWRPTLLMAVGKRLRAMAAPPAPERLQAPENESCAICGGVDGAGVPGEAIGRVYVPDPDRLHERKQCVVYCRCPLGRYYRASTPAIKVGGKECRVLTVDEIAERFEAIDPAPGHPPGWRGYLAWWRELRRKELSLENKARGHDREFGRLLTKLIEKRSA